jgi:cytochrome oxidase assembly protein ShyY1
VYRFLYRPRWIAFTLTVAALMVLMVFAAIWQWHRYEFKRDRRDQVNSLQAKPPTPLGTTAPAEWTIVTVTGTYNSGEQVLIKDRSQDGVPGFHVVAPLVGSDGRAVLINRGFIGVTARNQVPAPPTGTIIVTGRVRTSQKRGFLGPRDPAGGTLSALARVDVPRIAKQTAEPLYPGYVELIVQQPAVTKADPAPIPPPDLDLGPHLSYMGQWIIFTILAAVGWLIVVRRSARKQMGSRIAEVPEPTTT